MMVRHNVNPMIDDDDDGACDNVYPMTDDDDRGQNENDSSKTTQECAADGSTQECAADGASGGGATATQPTAGQIGPPQATFAQQQAEIQHQQSTVAQQQRKSSGSSLHSLNRLSS